MNLGLYILENGQPVPAPDVVTWGHWFESSRPQRIVALTKVGEANVSTVFLGIDHGFFGQRKPILWETMVFGGVLDEYQERYSSRDDALTGHERVVVLCRTAEEGAIP